MKILHSVTLVKVNLKVVIMNSLVPVIQMNKIVMMAMKMTSLVANTLEESQSEPDQSGSQSVNSQDLWNEIHSTQRQHDFIGREKVNISVDDREQLQPYDVFKKIVTDDILDLIVEQTNEYAKQYIDNTTLTRSCRAKQWVPTNRNEMRTFIGIVMSMGLVWTPDIHLYWSTKELYNRSFVSKTMP